MVPETSEGSPYGITEEDLVRGLHKQHYGHILPQIFVSFIACLYSISFGMALGWSKPVIYIILLLDIEKHQEYALIVGILTLGCSVGVISWSYIMSNKGPRTTLLVQTPFYVGTWCCMLLEDRLGLQTAASFFLGFCGIAQVICGEALLHDTVHHILRRHFLIVTRASMLLGIMLALAMAFVTNILQFVMFSISIPILNFCLLLCVHESPVFLYNIRQQRAIESLIFYRGPDYIYIDLHNIRKDREALRYGTDTYILYNKVVIKALAIVLGLTVFQTCSGYYIFLFFGMSIWNNHKVIITPLADLTLVLFSFFISRLVWGYIYSRVNWSVRRPLMISCTMVSIQLLMLSCYLIIDNNNKTIFGSHPWFLFVHITLYVFFYDMGLNYYPKALIGEYLPIQVLRTAFTTVTIFHWFLVSVNIYSFCFLFQLTNVVFAGLAVVACLGAIFTYFFVVEPKGKSLVRIQIELGGTPIGTRGAYHERLKANLEG